MFPLSAALVLTFGGAVARDGDDAPTQENPPAPAEVATGYATDEDLREFAQDLFGIIRPAAPPADAIEATRRERGAMLFFDPHMSSSGLFSCQSCHNVGMGGVEALPNPFDDLSEQSR